ncbi:MAG: DUF2283 domain-containing protein [Candidatus Thorarchaeota archaeon]|nr:DUF2283 domain-containing protein [Candidatus Thorarchaeota archaeon]
MRIDYDQVADSIYFLIKGGEIAGSVQLAEGVIVDYDKEGEVRGIEILAHSQRGLDLNRLVRLKDEELVAEVVGM